MKSTRSILLFVSAVMVVLMIGGGLAVKVGAGESSYHEVVVFSEILNLVMENYVDPVDAEKLLNGAFEGMLGGLDAHGAYLTPEEVASWKQGDLAKATAGFSVLKAGSALQVVAVEPGSPAETGGMLVGDQVRAIDGRPVRDLSLDQAWRLLSGPPKSRLDLDLLQPSEGFRRRQLELIRDSDRSEPYAISVERGIALLRVRDLRRLDENQVASDLEKLDPSIETLLIDLRNVADFHPREAAAMASLFASGTLLQLRDRSGRLTDVVESARSEPAWHGTLAVLVNGATAGSSEAFASVIQSAGDGMVIGEETYGLGAEPRLYELEDGAGLLVSSELWETHTGVAWNGEGVKPDEVVRGRGDDYAGMVADQLEKALDLIEKRAGEKGGASAEREAA